MTPYERANHRLRPRVRRTSGNQARAVLWVATVVAGMGCIGSAAAQSSAASEPAVASVAAASDAVASAVVPAAADVQPAADLLAVVNGEQRTPAFRQRDAYRHPAATLTFFGLRPDMKVVEIWPGNGWYTEILAPYLNPHGLLYEAEPADAGTRVTAANASQRGQVDFSQKLASRPATYGKVVAVPFSPPGFTDIRPPGGADMVLTFRNIHDWMKTGTTDAVFHAMANALKPGGILGIVEHRAQPGTSLQQMIDSGYVTEQYVIDEARRAGFQLVARSDINANPKDDTHHPHGVWSLPPSYAGGDADRAALKAIGESDRMTLKFVKR